MRFEPKGQQIIGRLAITKMSGKIVAPDEASKVSRFVMIDELSEAALAAGYKRGDLVLPRVVNNLFLRGGTFHRAVVSIEEILCIVHDVPVDELIDVNGKPFERQEAAA